MKTFHVRHARDAWSPRCSYLSVAGSALAQAPPTKLRTKWAAEVTPTRVLPEYPRPEMARPGWQNLNGLWDYAILDAAAQKPRAFAGKILVPVCRAVTVERCRRARSPINNGSGIGARFVRRHDPARLADCCCTSARSTGKRTCSSTAEKSAATAAATIRFRSTSRRRSRAPAIRNSSSASGIPPTRGRSRAASRCSSRRASGTRR